MIKVYEKNDKTIILNTENEQWLRMSDKFYNANKNKKEFLSLLDKKFSFLSKAEESEMNPTTIYFSVTKKCNLKCKFCSMGSNSNVDTSKDLSIAQMKKSIPILLNDKIRKVVITGGEPFERQDIFEILDVITNDCSKEKIILQTNGLLLDESKIERLRNYISTVEISIENVVADINLKKVMQKKFALINKHGIALSLSYVVTDENVPYIEDGMQMALDYDAFFTYRFVEPLGVGSEMFDGFDVMEQFKWTLDTQRRVMDFILKHKAWNHKLAQSVKSVLLPGKVCGAFTNIVAVQPNGDLYPCINTCNSILYMGNLVTDEKEVIDKNIEERGRNIEIQKRFHIDYKDKCTDCFYKYFCNGICGAIQFDNLSLKEKYENYICKIRQTQLEFNMFFSDKNWSEEQYLYALRDYLSQV